MFAKNKFKNHYLLFPLKIKHMMRFIQNGDIENIQNGRQHFVENEEQLKLQYINYFVF